MSGFVLREARPGDGAAIAAMVLALATYERLAHEARGSGDDFERELFGANPVTHALIAEIGGQPVGFALWFYNFSTFEARRGLYLEDLFVDSAHRGQGIGRAFLRVLAQRAVADGCARMEWSVLDWNEPAIRFYRSLGAVGMEDWTVQRLGGAALAALADVRG